MKSVKKILTILYAFGKFRFSFLIPLQFFLTVFSLLYSLAEALSLYQYHLNDFVEASSMFVRTQFAAVQAIVLIQVCAVHIETYLYLCDLFQID